MKIELFHTSGIFSLDGLDFDVRVIDEDGVLLRHFELDPSVDYQAKSRDIV